MVISEYMPKRLQRVGRLLRGGFVAVSAVLAIHCARETGRLQSRESEYQRLRQEVMELRQLQKQGEEALRGGDLMEGESLLLAAIAQRTSDPEPYLLLADLYTEQRLYEEALEILDAYGGNNAAIDAKTEELKGMVDALERSAFAPQE